VATKSLAGTDCQPGAAWTIPAWVDEEGDDELEGDDAPDEEPPQPAATAAMTIASPRSQPFMGASWRRGRCDALRPLECPRHLAALRSHRFGIVSSRLGHSTVALTLDVYSHVLPQADQEAAEKIADLVPVF
jgi:hypothetical protein